MSVSETTVLNTGAMPDLIHEKRTYLIWHIYARLAQNPGFLDASKRAVSIAASFSSQSVLKSFRQNYSSLWYKIIL